LIRNLCMILSIQKCLMQHMQQRNYSRLGYSKHGSCCSSYMVNYTRNHACMFELRIGSQERENSVKKIACLPPISYTREESQMPISRSSTNLMRKWNSTSAADHQLKNLSRIGIMETSLNRFGMILDSVQSDIMHVNKGTKEALMEMEVIRQKLIANDNLMQLMNMGQEDVKTNLVGGVKSISDRVSQDRDRLKEISSMISALPEQIDLCLQKLKSELCKTVTQEMQAIPCTLSISSQKHLTPTVLLERGISCRVTPQQMPTLKNPQVRPKFCGKATVVPKVELGSWTSVKKEKATFTCRGSSKEHRQKRLFPIELCLKSRLHYKKWTKLTRSFIMRTLWILQMQTERERRIVIESDAEIDVGFSRLLEEKDTDIGNYSMEEAKEETKRILRKARREKRKYSNAIILI
ncbi:Protein PAIR1, partial [Camellia lanceoleosa]